MLPASHNQPATTAQAFAGLVPADPCENGEVVDEHMDLAAMERALAGVLDLPRLTNLTPEETLQWLAERNPRMFLAAGIKRLERAGESPGYRKRSLRVLEIPAFLVELVRSERFDNQGLIEFCAMYVREDPLLDVKLARLMPGRQVDTYQLGPAIVLRILEVLDLISPGPRLLMIIGHLTHYKDHHVASKAALLVGRRLQSHEWIERHLASADARIRANVAEALWGRKSGLASRTIRRCLHDENNRVQGNAIVGLNLLSDQHANWRIRHLAKDVRPTYRQTAAWVIGKLGDREFVPVLEELLLDVTQAVRRTAETAMQRFPQPTPSPVIAEYNRNISLGAVPVDPQAADSPKDGAVEAPVLGGQRTPGSRPKPAAEAEQNPAPTPEQSIGDPAFTLRFDGRYVTGG